jgi:tetratricopeptide (TPR) repeat protein
MCTRDTLRVALLLAVSLSWFFSFTGCAKKKPTNNQKNQDQQTSGINQQQQKTAEIKEARIAEYQDQLLEVAFEAANFIPIEPFKKERARAQQHVVETCIDLGQTLTAVEYTRQITNWRKGLCYGKIAFYCAENNYKQNVDDYILLAEEIAAMDHGQEWRSDIIRVEILKAKKALGQSIAPQNFEESETGKIVATDAGYTNQEYFENQVAKLDALIEKETFDITKNALYSYAKLFDRCYEDVEKRKLIEEKIFENWGKMPLPIKFNIYTKLARYALDNNDQEKALELIAKARDLLEDYEWHLDTYISNSSKIVELLYEANDKQAARQRAEELLKAADERLEEDVRDYKRARALYPLAQALKFIGSCEKSLAVYKWAVEEATKCGVKWVTAKDLSETCCSMALYSVEPDDELWARIKEISNGFVVKD